MGLKVERRYLSLEKAAVLLDCDVEDIIHLAVNNQTKIGLPYQSNGFHLDFIHNDEDMNLRIEDGYFGFGFIDSGYLIDAELTGLCTFNVITIEDGRIVKFPPSPEDFSSFKKYAIDGLSIKNLFIRAEEFNELNEKANQKAIPLKDNDSLGGRERNSLLRIIAALHETVLQHPSSQSGKPLFSSQNELISFLEAKYEGYEGVTKSNLEKRFPEARKTLEI